MKTQETLRKHLGVLVFILSAILIATTMNACGKKNDGGGGTGPGYNPYGGPPGCVGCPPQGGNVLSTGFGIHNPNTVALGLTFYGQGQTQGGGYYGAVTAQGELFVGPQAGSYFCPLAPGVYNVTTVQPGQWANQSVGNLMLEGNGPSGRVQFAVVQGGVYGAYPYIQYQGRTYPNYFWNNLVIISVNGQPCQQQNPYFLQ